METKKKDNRSVRKTKNNLKDALMELMSKKPINSITVKELCDMADVNRGTFYFHYTDIYDMLTQIEDQAFSELESIFNVLGTKEPKENEAPVLSQLFYFLQDNSLLAKNMLGKNGDINFVNHIKDFVDEKCSQAWKGFGNRMSQENYKYFNSFIINGCVGLVQTWLNNDMNKTPEEMAILAADIIIPAGRVSFTK